MLHAGGTYERNLTLARIGILPFFIIASLVVALWAKNCGGTTTSLLATLLFTTLPPILAHAGLATLDLACAALVAAALFAFTLWLSRPTLLRSFILGISLGLAILSRLSALSFLFVAGGLIIAIYSINSLRKSPIKNADFPKFKQWFAASVIALLISVLTIWAGYRFSFSPLEKPENRPYKTVDSLIGTEGIFHDISYFIIENTPIPAPEFRKGINESLGRNKQGHLAYLLGEIKKEGWWYFFPIVLLVKTPLPFILLSVLGFFSIFRNIFRKQEWFQVSVPAIASMGILVIGMLSRVDNGIRQILSIYPLLAIVAGYGAFKLLSFNQRFKFVGLGLVTVLLSWQLISSFAAHPDYLAYFNELARNHPEKIVVDSDLDWGQDLKRLALTIKNRGINELTIKYNGSMGIDLDQFNLPPRQELKPYQREIGWIAISIFSLTLGTGEAPYDQFSWLREYQPVEQVGKSIWLYYIPKN
jgi:4-amino-4-deoxy-L-arabinose transferase-like glycosyltransferase